MRYLRYLALIAALMIFAAYSQAQVGFGVAIGSPPVCEYGFYPYTPYACAPYGYWGPSWFANGIFIGAGPWYNFYYTHPGFYRGYYRRFGGYGSGWRHFNGYAGNGWHSFNRGYVPRGYAYGRGYGRGYVGNGYRAPAVNGYRGGGGFRGGFHGSSGFHSGGGHGGHR